MSPEQAIAKDVDHRTDLYSLAIILYEMLTGRPPFQSETPVGTLLAHVRDPLPPPQSLNPSISDGVQAVVAKALAKAAYDRYESAGEFASALAASINNETATVFSMRSPFSPDLTLPRMPLTGGVASGLTPPPSATVSPESPAGMPAPPATPAPVLAAAAALSPSAPPAPVVTLTPAPSSAPVAAAPSGAVANPAPATAPGMAAPQVEAAVGPRPEGPVSSAIDQNEAKSSRRGLLVGVGLAGLALIAAVLALVVIVPGLERPAVSTAPQPTDIAPQAVTEAANPAIEVTVPASVPEPVAEAVAAIPEPEPEEEIAAPVEAVEEEPPAVVAPSAPAPARAVAPAPAPRAAAPPARAPAPPAAAPAAVPAPAAPVAPMGSDSQPAAPAPAQPAPAAPAPPGVPVIPMGGS